MKKIKINEKNYSFLKEFVDSDMTPSQNKIPNNLGGNSEITTNDKMSDDDKTEEPLTSDKFANGLYRNHLIGTPKSRPNNGMVKENNEFGKIAKIDTLTQQNVKDKLNLFIDSLTSVKDKPKDMSIILNFIVETFIPYINDLSTKNIIRNKIK